MPINNVCIQKRRLRELTKILKTKGTGFESLAVHSLDSYKQFTFVVSNMSVGLIQDLKDNGFEIAYIGSRNDKILVSVYNEVTYEKASRNTQEIMQRGYRTRDRIEQQRWVWLWNSEYKEVVRLRAELKSKEESIQQLCKRVVDLKNEKEAIESGVNMFALFFDTVEMLQK